MAVFPLSSLSKALMMASMIIPDIIAIISLFTAFILLIALSAIDLKLWILPNKLVLAFALCGALFHIATNTSYITAEDSLAGAIVGFGMLYAVRFFANRHYDRDSLGLGDVKLIGAAGLWLGLEGVILAITLGAFVGLLHGLAYAAYKSIKDKKPFSIRRLAIPAGPGFALGITLSGGWLLQDFVKEFMRAILS